MTRNGKVLVGMMLLLLLGAGARAEDKDDVLLRAMQEELQRSQTQLQLKEMRRPYYIEYSVQDVDEYSASATFGALRYQQRNRVRMGRVVVRVGNYSKDSYFAAGQGVADLVPLDDDILALRHRLWLATDKAYKMALEAYTTKEALLQQVVVEDELPDFSREPALKDLGNVATLDFDPAPWLRMIRNVSRLFLDSPDVQSSEALLRFRAVNRYFMNSEGSVSRQGATDYVLYFSGETQAPDGMSLERSKDYTVADLREMPSLAQAQRDARTLMGTLAALRQAPVVEEDYRGPVLFVGDGSSMVFTRLLAANVLGNRPRPGDPSRTSGEYSTYYRSRVLPDFFTVVDDPLEREFQGHTLLGYYPVDDEGVRAQRVQLVDDGLLVNYLLGRTPIRDFAHSNGHARAPAGIPPQPAVGTLFIRARQAKSNDELQKMMGDLCRERDLPYGYVVETATPDLTPRLIYRLWIEDGRRELVRGALFGHLDVRALRSDVIAAGSDLYLDNRADPVPQSVISPPILFEELEVRRANRTRESLPAYPAPSAEAAASAGAWSSGR